jgi:ABC-type multidrug transport system fused ATPase/permease subunit
MPSQTHSTLASGLSTPPSDDEVLVRVEGVSKKFCRSLKKSLWYGVCDIAGELLPGRKRESQRSELTTKHTKLHEKGGAGPCLGEPSGAAFSNSSASELARDSENTSLTRCAGDPASGSGEHSVILNVGVNSVGVGVADAAAAGGREAWDEGRGRGLPTLDSASEGLRPGEFWAVRDVSFELRRGECLGLIGHNGAGKTTLLKMLNGLIKPDRGSITMRGRVGALIALGAGFNPILTGACGITAAHFTGQGGNRRAVKPVGRATAGWPEAGQEIFCKI